MSSQDIDGGSILTGIRTVKHIDCGEMNRGGR